MSFEVLDAALADLSGKLGLPVDQLALVLVMGAAMFTGVGLNVILGLNLPKAVRYSYTIGLGVFLQIFLYRWQAIHIYIMSGMSFLMFTYLPRDLSHILVTGWVAIYNSALFLYFMITCFGCWNMDVSTYTMMLTAKLWGLAWALRDGYNHKQNLSESQRKLRVVELPTFVEFMGFVAFAPGCVVGPFIEYRDYIDYMERQGDYKDMPCGTSMPTLVPGVIQMLKSYAMGFLH